MHLTKKQIAQTLLSEIQDFEETLDIIKKRVGYGQQISSSTTIDPSRINNLIGKYQLLSLIEKTEID
jgi:hypothetical protein